MRLIDADALKNAIRAESWKEDNTVKMAVDYICIIIDEQPTINPDDCRPHGRWEIKLDDYDCEYAMCPVCGEEFYDASGEDTIDITFNYCPNCGAKMDGKEQGE